MKPSTDNLRVAFVDSSLDMGGTTTYLESLTKAIMLLGGVTPRIFSLQASNPLGEVFARQQVDVLTQDDQRLIYEDRLVNTLASLSAFAPHCVIAWHGSPCYEVLRYVPNGVWRIGVVHASYPTVYADAKPFGPEADIWVGVSRLIAEEFSRFAAVPIVKTRAIGAGVEPPVIDVRRTVNPDQPLRVLYLGRLDRLQKRSHLLSEVYDDLCRHDVPVTFTIAGDGPERPALMQRMRDHGTAQKVCFPGNVSRDALPDLLADNDILLLISVFEGLPVSLLEGMAYGLVPVVSKLPGGICETIDSQLGCLVDPDQIAGYGEAIRWLHQHRAEMKTMAQACQTQARERYSATARAREWLDLIGESQGSPVEWPKRFHLKPRLVHGRHWDFHEPVRSIRRLAKRWRSPAT